MIGSQPEVESDQLLAKESSPSGLLNNNNNNTSSPLTPPVQTVCQNLWSLLGSAVGKMVAVTTSTKMSFSPQPELFARSLRRRLQSLTPDRQTRAQSASPLENDPDNSLISDGEISMQPQALEVPLTDESEDDRIRRILERGLRLRTEHGVSVITKNASFPLPGTTFPPNRFLSGDILRAKVRSESDLHPAVEHLPDQAQPEVVDGSPCEDQLMGISGVEICDSDLFFDFDIGSPEPEIDVDECLQVHGVINETDDGMAIALGQGTPDGSEASSNSPTLLDNHRTSSPIHHSPSTTEPSTAYGSTSSGLYSDVDAQAITSRDEECASQDLSEGFSLHPEDWLRNHVTSLTSAISDDKSSSATPIVSPPNTQQSAQPEKADFQANHEEEAISNDDAIGTEPTVDNDSTKATLDPPTEVATDASDLEEGQGVKICIGEQERIVAHSKLQALLAQLEKSNDFSATEDDPLDRNVRASSMSSAATDNTDNSVGGVSHSPANFSFLVGSVGSALSNNSLSVKPQHMARCQSTLDVSEYDKSKVRAVPKSSADLSAVAASAAKTSKKASTTDEIRTKDDDTRDKREKYRKCSSLRSGKTPPGTPARRKIVRFADVFGLDLADVKTFLDEVPNVPKSAFRDLKDAELSDMESDSGSDLRFPVLPPTKPPIVPTFKAPSSKPTIAPLFNQPSGSSEFFNHLRDKKVSLETAYMSDVKTIKGVVRVVNLDYNKRVVVRYTFDDWKTIEDVVGEYMSGSCDGFSDKFSFFIDYSPIAGLVGRRLQFCIKFECAGNDYWDNNFGKNYVFQCFGPAAADGAEASDGSSSANSQPIPAPRSPAKHPTTFSHSPSCFSEDPWLIYL